MAHSILVINGPNLNLLGTREPGIYGADTLEDVNALCETTGKEAGAKITCFQSNYEGAIVDEIHAARRKHDAIVINPAAYSHTSVAIRDALSGVAIPVYEIHISNIHTREEFRHHSFVSAIAKTVICGMGVRGYAASINAAIADLNET